MDQVEHYKQIITEILNAHAQIPYSHGEIERLAIQDEENDSYILMSVGWNKRQRVHSIVFHVRIRDGKIWVEDDWTEYGVANELVDAGVPKEDIVLAFHLPEERPYTEFAVA
jgi:hypothetical protein